MSIFVLDDFSKNLSYDNQVSHGAFFFLEFHDRRPNYLGKKESQKNHRSGSMRASLAQLSYGINYLKYQNHQIYQKINTKKYKDNVKKKYNAKIRNKYLTFEFKKSCAI